MTYGAVEQAESRVGIPGDARRVRTTAGVEAALRVSVEMEMNEHFANVDRSHRLIEALYQCCLIRHGEVLTERGAGQ